MRNNDGLDLTTLRALSTPRHDVDAVLARIATHLETHDGYVAFSGGKDSTAVLDLARTVDPAVPVAFFDSGAEYPQTYSYITELAERWSLNLTIYPSAPPLLDALAATGQWDHHHQGPTTPVDLHDLLITAPAAAAHLEHGPGELWGVRADESAGRRAMYGRALRRETADDCSPDCCSDLRSRRARHGGVVRRLDGTAAFGPIWNWSTADVLAHLARQRIPPNPVYDILTRMGAPEHAHRVSHVVDGNFLERGRLVWLRRGWPALFEEYAEALPRIREFA